jgi:hypothetical protein
MTPAAAHRQGFEDAVRLFAIMNDGVSRIGAKEHTIAEVLHDYDLAAWRHATHGSFTFGINFPEPDPTLSNMATTRAHLAGLAYVDLAVSERAEALGVAYNPTMTVACLGHLVDEIGAGAADEMLESE